LIQKQPTMANNSECQSHAWMKVLYWIFDQRTVIKRSLSSGAVVIEPEITVRQDYISWTAVSNNLRGFCVLLCVSVAISRRRSSANRRKKVLS
jgi:hypothetical protein